MESKEIEEDKNEKVDEEKIIKNFLEDKRRNIDVDNDNNDDNDDNNNNNDDNNNENNSNDSNNNNNDDNNSKNEILAFQKNCYKTRKFVNQLL